jgi:hypothetical protein
MAENLVLAIFLIWPCIAGYLLGLVYRRVRAQHGRAGWLLLLLGNLLLTLALVGLLFLTGEVYYRFVYDSTDSMGFTKVSQRWFVNHYHRNGAKVRDDREYYLALTPGQHRITFIGDSFTAGHGIKHVEDRFANLLRNQHPDWEIHVMAMLGFDTGDEVDYLAGWLEKGYQLDEVVLVYCLNDIGDLVPEQRADVNQVFWDATHGSWLRQNSYFLNTIYFRLKIRLDPHMRAYFGYVRSAYQNAALWEHQKRRLTAFRDLVNSHGGRLAVVTFPFFHTLGSDYEYEFVHTQLDQFWRSLNVPHLDLLPVYRSFRRDQLTVNRYDAHPNEYAHALAAPVIDRFLNKQLARGDSPHTNQPSGPLPNAPRSADAAAK